MKTYKLLKELIYHLSNAETNMIMRFLEEMDDVEFSQVQTLLFTEETRKVFDTYATVFLIDRKDNSKEGRTTHKFYSIGASFFRVVV